MLLEATKSLLGDSDVIPGLKAVWNDLQKSLSLFRFPLVLDDKFCSFHWLWFSPGPSHCPHRVEFFLCSGGSCHFRSTNPCFSAFKSPVLVFVEVSFHSIQFPPPFLLEICELTVDTGFQGTALGKATNYIVLR